MNITYSLPYRILLGSFLGIILIVSALRAQPFLDDGVVGTTYIIAFPDTTSNNLDPRFPNNSVQDLFQLFIYSAKPGSAKISNGGVWSTVELSAGKFVTCNVAINPVVTVSNAIQENTVRVESLNSLVIYSYFATKQSCEAWAPIPVELWGTEHNVAAIPGETVAREEVPGTKDIVFTRLPSPAEFMIISAYDNTKIVVTNFGRRFNGSPDYTLTLGENQCHQVQSWVDTTIGATRQTDIGGVRIASDKPIGVISGNSRARADKSGRGISGNAWKNMMMEWITPTEQHGTAFVYMPSWDALHPGGGANIARDSEHVRIYGTYGNYSAKYRDTTRGSYSINGVRRSFRVLSDTLIDIAIHPAQAVYFETDHPAMAIMHSESVVRVDTSYPGGGLTPNRTYSGTAPYMVELVPREQWLGFSAFYAPTNPTGMEHYINVVADTASAKRISLEDGGIFPFTWTIPGTDLIWGTMPVTPGVTHTLTGSNGAKFAGYVYGLRRGSEKIEFPGGPARYEEINALSYGYPLAPGRNVLRQPDSLRIDTTVGGWLHITIRALNPSPVGLRSIAFDPASVINSTMLPIDPSRLSDLIGRTTAKVDVRPVDMLKDASATVIIKDRTGATHYVYYHYYAFVLTPDRQSIDFGDVQFGTTPTDTITFTNLRDSVVDAYEVRLLTKNFTLIITDPPIASRPMLKPGESLKLVVQFNGNNPDGPYADSLILVFANARRAIFMHARIVNGPPAGIDLHSAPLPGYALDGARPNPAGGKTIISYHLGASGRVNMSIYNAVGELVAVPVDGTRSAGEGSITWDASALPGGTYYCRIRAGAWSAALPIVVVK